MSSPRLAASTTIPPYEVWRADPPSAAGPSTQTYHHQTSLPPLPVPKLDDTLRKLKASGKAVARDGAEASTFEGNIDAFANDGLSRELQRRLEVKADQTKSRNWIAEDWDRLAYMTYRDSVVCNVSYYYGFERLPQRAGGTATREDDKADPAYVAASIAAYALWYRDELAQGNVKPDVIGGAPVCMESYKWLFNACRIPTHGEDYATKVQEDALEGDHFILIRQNRFYKLRVRDESHNRLSFNAIHKAIKQVYNDAPSSPDPPIGVFTGVNRDTWADARAHLLEDPTNSESLRTIEDAAFVICLDTDKPSIKGDAARTDFSNKLWRGNARCRFYDKPLQWVVFDSGESGVIGEHSCMDGTPTASLNDLMTRALIAGEAPPEPETASDTLPAKAEPLKFHVDSRTQQSLQAAELEYDRHVANYELRFVLYTRYGKDAIKAAKTSPDGWVQMIMQLAYALTHDGASAATYESAQVRRFALGRTEVVRVCTEASRAFTKAMLDGQSSGEEKRRLFKEAVAQQGKDMKDASNALGIDRHLFGLKRMLKEGEKAPALFSDPVFARSSHWQMSTSQVYGRQFSTYGWGPVVDDGYGLPYLIQPELLMFTVTAKKGNPIDKYLANVERAADMILELMHGSLSPKL